MVHISGQKKKKSPQSLRILRKFFTNWSLKKIPPRYIIQLKKNVAIWVGQGTGREYEQAERYYETFK